MTQIPEAMVPHAVRVPDGSFASNLRAIKVVWQRDLIRYWRDKTRLVASLLQPILYLFVLGGGLSPVAQGGAGGVDLRTFMFPGVLAMAVMFSAAFSAGSIVWDREFGFMREMLVAPVSRTAIVVGKCVGGATVSTIQGALVLVLAGLVGVPYDPWLILQLLVFMALLAFTMTAFGVMAAARVKSFQAYMGLVQLFIMPLFFLSGALFPLANLPSWLAVLTRLNPLTYAVDPMRRAVFATLDVGAGGAHAPGITWGDWLVPTWLELLLVVVLGSFLLSVAVARFRKIE